MNRDNNYNIKSNYKVLVALMSLDIGGAETHVLELCKALKARGLTIYVASNGGVYEKELRDAGITHYKVPLHNKKLSNMLYSYKYLKKIITENNIKLVHAHARIPAFLCGLLQKKLQFRFVTTAHFSFSVVFPFKLLSNWGERALTVSGDLSDYLIKNYSFAPENIKLTINGIDTDKFSPGTDYSDIIREFGLDINKKRIVLVSRLDKEATMPAHQLLECAPAIYEAYKNVEIILVGNGDDYEELSRKAAEVNKNIGHTLVYMTGARTDINKFIASAYLSVGVSRAILEAMTCCPVVLSGKQGYLGVFDKEKLEAAIETNFCCRGCGFVENGRLINDILYLLNADNARLTELKAFCRETVEKYYSVDKMAEDALEIYESVRYRKKEIDVMISGYYGDNNSGDDSLLKSIVDDIRKAKKDANIVVLSKRPKETSAIYGVGSIFKFNLPAINKCLKNTNLLITGGGTLIQDITSTQSLIYYLYVINSAYKRGARNMLYSNGISVRHEINKKRAQDTLNKVDIITLREAESLNVLKEIGVDKPIIRVTADAAFALGGTDGNEAAELLEHIGVSRGYFVVTVRDWKSIPQGFEAELAAFADYIKESYNIEALFIPMQPHVDSRISRRIISLMKKPGLFVDTRTPNQMLGIMAKAEFMLTMRLHTVIYAAQAGTPVIALVYDPKVKSMMDTLGQRFYVDLNATGRDVLKKFSDDIMANREEVSESIFAAGAREREKAADNIKLALELMGRSEF